MDYILQGKLSIAGIMHRFINSELLPETGIDPQKLKLYIPLHFWFCDNPGLYLPIVGITKHDVSLTLTTRSVENLFNLDGELSYTNTVPQIDMWCNYIFLDKDEKRKFLLEKKAYLIQQVQKYEKDTSLINPIKLPGIAIEPLPILNFCFAFPKSISISLKSFLTLE